MRVRRLNLQFEKKKIGTLFTIGMIFGILIMNIGKGVLLGETGLFDEEILNRMKYMTVDSDALFCYVLRKRMLLFLWIAVLSTTYLGLAVRLGGTVLCGITFGMYLASLTVRYSVKGCFFAFVGCFPHGVCYILALLLLWRWNEEVNHMIYRNRAESDTTWKKEGLKKLIQLSVIFGLIIVGCLLEGYINPGILKAYLKIF